MTGPALQVLAQFVAERALNSVAGGLLIAALAWLVLRLIGKQSSGTRFVVWFSALVAIAGLPFMPGLGHVSTMTGGTHAEVTLPGVWALAIFVGWVFLAALAATRLLVGLWNLRRLRSSGVPLVSLQLPAPLRDTLAQCQAVRPVAVCSSAAVTVPTAIGFFQPAILIPEWALRDLPPEELRIILLHEFAHLRRWDDWTNLAQKIIRTAFFFHPAVWWIEKKLSLEREMACDEEVLTETGNARAYAECLVSLAERSFVRRSLALAQAAISHARETSLRLARILDAGRPLPTRVSRFALALITAAAGVCLLLLPIAPKLIAFENSPPSQQYSAANEALSPRMPVHVISAAMPISVDSTGASAMPKVVSTPALYRPSKPVADEFRRGSVLPKAVAPSQRRDVPAIAPMLVDTRQSAPPQEFLLVMQRAEFDERGSVTVSFSVWCVTFAGPAGNAIQQQVAAGKI